MSARKRDWYAALLIVGIAVAGTWTIRYATRPGIGLYSDSTIYLSWRYVFAKRPISKSKS
jgi:hypothetical protein